MRVLLLALALWLALAPTAAARNPRLEHLALRQSDMEFAKNAVLRNSDLATGWTTRATEPDDTSPPECPGQDYSRFTITGQAQTQSRKAGASIVSRVEVYRTRAEALGDFAVDARPGTAACEGAAIRKEWSAHGIATRLISAGRLPAPKVGQRSIAFRIVLEVTRERRKVRINIDLIGFVRDRVAASVVVLAPGTRPKGVELLVQKIESRLLGAA